MKIKNPPTLPFYYEIDSHDKQFSAYVKGTKIGTYPTKQAAISAALAHYNQGAIV